MSVLGDALRQIIATEGPISVERFMLLALQHPVHGYYTSKMPFGRAGDFVTAPDVSQMFGELVGLWAAQVWLDMGAPHGLHLVELGPGRGTMMADALRATRVVPGFLAGIDVHLVETSPILKDAQENALAAVGMSATWHTAMDTVPDGPAILLANEFFDALPVRHYVRGATGWHERQVDLGPDGALAFGAAAEPMAIDAFLAAGPGAVLEIGHAARRVMTALAGRIATHGGALLVCDYGHAETSLGETLQAIQNHAFVDPLAAPGEADLTTHVDFAMLRRTAETAGTRVTGPLAQGAWLERLGIGARARALKVKAGPDQAVVIDAALARLTGPTSSMATLFKVLAVTHRDMMPPPGFEDPA
ncbi:class I SAM-dependent methyltransferase [Beijerinckia sp. L45]|uniref:class I SAM-dependent methyltransferase n=1 Tax=Beijerinckia sp. L45 TaxID=1641855 RepID=UPI00131E3789|nr:SAM-dependent methyltransferase [Beijerinckia sp. L45]